MYQIFKSRRKYRYFIKDEHVEVASTFMKTNSCRKVTVNDVKNHLAEVIPAQKLSKTGVHFLISKVIGYSYKKAHKIPRKMTTNERIRDFIEWAWLQIHLEKEGYKLINLDEFHISMKNRSTYNWSKRGTPACWVIDPDPYVMSFVVSFSWNWIEGILASNISIKSFSFKKFVKDIWKMNAEKNDCDSNKACLVFDNASFHVNKDAAGFYKNKMIKW